MATKEHNLGDEPQAADTVQEFADVKQGDENIAISKGKTISEDALWTYLGGRRTIDKANELRVSLRRYDQKSKIVPLTLEGDFSQVDPKDPEKRTYLAVLQAEVQALEK